MVCASLVFGGDLRDPNVGGFNKYKLYSRSIGFQCLYTLVLLYSVGIAGMLVLAGKSILSNCYYKGMEFVFLGHLVKPFLIAILLKLLPSKPCLCNITRLCPTIFIDLPYAWFAFTFLYIPFNQCSPKKKSDYNHYMTAEHLQTIIIWSILVIHCSFVLLSVFRFVEVMSFEGKRSKFARQLNRPNDGNNPANMRPEDAPLVSNDELMSRHSFTLTESEMVAVVMDNPNQHHSSVAIERVNENEINDILDDALNQFANEIVTVFQYGQMENKSDDSAQVVEETSLSNFFMATTRFLSSGIMKVIDTEDVCCICYDGFRIGTLTAKLVCGHLFHRECAVDWLQNSATCPLCRIVVSKKN